METAADKAEEMATIFSQSNPLYDLDMKLNNTDLYEFQSSDIKTGKPRGRGRCLPMVVVYLILLTGINAFLAYKVFTLESQIHATGLLASDSRTDKQSAGKLMPPSIEIPQGEREDLLTQVQNVSLEASSLRGGLGALQTRVTNLCGEEGALGRLRAELGMVNSSTHLLHTKLDEFSQKTGPPGQPGPRGPEGMIGQPGAPGAKGDVGDRGEPGSAGPMGEKGNPGTAGEAGPAGTKGESGERGETGPVGNPGPIGPAGQEGAKGDPGDQGHQGQPGPSGEKGEQGGSGLSGSAAAGLKGEPGHTGPAGPLGARGPVGQPGSKGDNGNLGEQGSVGPQGTHGEKGATGLNGDRGQIGIPGVPGPVGRLGPKGEPGSAGERGSKGQTGPRGLQGEKGSPGVQGIRGEKGERESSKIVRLVGGSSRGRVELLYQDVWGTVCDDNFDVKDGTVICKMLGFNRALSVYTAPPGTGRIWLDDLGCTGAESSILACTHSGMGVTNCIHSEDAGVSCA